MPCHLVRVRMIMNIYDLRTWTSHLHFIRTFRGAKRLWRETPLNDVWTRDRLTRVGRSELSEFAFVVIALCRLSARSSWMICMHG